MFCQVNFLKDFQEYNLEQLMILSYNEMIEDKRKMIEENLLADAQSKLLVKND